MNLPSEFIERTRALIGKEAYGELETALQAEPPVSIRVNGSKCPDVSVEGAQRVPWASEGIYLTRRPTFTFDPLFHAGCYYVQEASSMFVGQVLRTYVKSPVVMLDLCAAPGGKSTHARSVLPEGSLLVANEVVRTRVQVLAENLMKWGNAEVVVTNNDPADFAGLPDMFDVLLTDVPCSGEGMFRKDAASIDEWSTDNVEACWKRQRKILTDVWPALKPGGLLIYSTCTYNKEENEENVAWIARELGAEVLDVPICPDWGVTGNLSSGHAFPVYRFMPHRTKGEGFFLAALRKLGDADGVARTGQGGNKKKKEGKGAAKRPVIPSQAVLALQSPDDFQVELQGTEVVAFPKEHAATYALLQEKLRLVHAGITLGTVKGKDFIPHHSLALSTSLRQDSFPRAELSYEQAIAYLRKEAVTLDASVPRGYVLLTYRDVPVGFAKNVGNRANNLYPQEWRIRSGYLPDEVCLVW